jgi:heat shock protein HslJ
MPVMHRLRGKLMNQFLLLGLVAILIAGCSSVNINDSSQGLIGEWHIEYIAGRPVIDYSPATITFTEDLKLAGNASCNRYFGSYTLNNDKLKIGSPMGSTMMMCAEALMDQEGRMMKALEAVETMRLENGLLILVDSSQKEMIRASRVEKASGP